MEALTSNTRDDFFRTLSLLKAKDPSIIKEKLSQPLPSPDDDQDDAEEEGTQSGGKEATKKKTEKAKPVFLKDHERNRLLTKGEFAFVDDEEDSGQGRGKKGVLLSVQLIIEEMPFFVLPS